MKGLLDRLFGRDNVEELNSLLGIIYEHWLQYFKEGWASLTECFRKIVDIELRSESPYESMKRAYPEEWHRAMHRQFIINLTPDGIRFNDYYGI